MHQDNVHPPVDVIGDGKDSVVIDYGHVDSGETHIWKLSMVCCSQPMYVVMHGKYHEVPGYLTTIT